jgi:hypothetical protein
MRRASAATIQADLNAIVGTVAPVDVTTYL